MKKLLLALMLIPAICACHHIEEWNNDAKGNFDALWKVFDEHYCFFREKGIDWDSVYNVYSPLVTDETNILQLFDICSEMVNELKDGHVNIISSFNTSYYKKWWSDYPQNYNERLVEQYYLNFEQYSRNGLQYAMLQPDSIGYIRYASFSYPLSETTLDWALALLYKAHGLIIDVRDNGGGNMTNVEILVRRFIDKRISAGFICHKTGPGHGDFSEPYEYFYDPAEEGRIMWRKPVVVLANRSTFSAANNFVSIMKSLPNVIIAGDRTGGGSGMPFSSEIPCGWAVRFSGSPVYDSSMQTTEDGIAPTEGCHVDLNPDLALLGRDTMLDFAIRLLVQESNEENDEDE